MRFTTSSIATAVGGELVGDDVVVEGAAIDSRALRVGQLFVPVRGTRDGHDFIASARESGAAATFSARGGVDGFSTVVVEEVETALGRLGAAARDRLPDSVVGITGSVGKTTAKDLAAAVLARRFRVGASEKSFNNELGVPLTLINVPDDTEVTVVEMGARGEGHIAELCRLVRPTVAVVTAVELAHSEHMGGLDDIARVKGELVEALPVSGTAILNAENDRVRAMRTRTRARVLTFGRTGGDVRASAVRVDEELRPLFRLETDWGTAEVRLAVRGAHNVVNALAAAATGLVSGVPVEEVAAGLAEANVSPWRMELGVGPRGERILNDSYNAGPASMAGALDALQQLPARRRHAVLGPMAELGAHGAEAHRSIAARAEQHGIRLIAFDTGAYGTAPVHSVEEAVQALGPLDEGDAVLVKGSRIAGLERLAEALLRP